MDELTENKSKEITYVDLKKQYREEVTSQYRKTADEVQTLANMTNTGWSLSTIKYENDMKVYNRRVGAAIGGLFGTLFGAWAYSLSLKRAKKKKSEENTTVDQENEAE